MFLNSLCNSAVKPARVDDQVGEDYHEFKLAHEEEKTVQVNDDFTQTTSLMTVIMNDSNKLN